MHPPQQIASFLVFSTFLACAGPEPQLSDTSKLDASMSDTTRMPGNIIASNAFFYYADLDSAWSFYRDTLGLATVADYGFAKIMRIATTSYLTLVDAESGMHSADEPKTVAIALITDQLDEWYQYLDDRETPMRSGFNPAEGRPHDGFVALDPEGYYLEFERFNPHAENDRLMPILDSLETVPVGGDAASGGAGNAGLGFKATILWLYYRDLPGIQRFYEDAMGFDMVADQGWTKIYPLSPSGLLGLVDQSRGMHSWTEDKAVTVSFLTEDIDDWFAHLEAESSFELRTPGVSPEGRVPVRTFVGYDPEGYFLEFDTFLEGEGNEELMRLLRESGS